jgi:hypothetical protein
MILFLNSGIFVMGVNNDSEPRTAGEWSQNHPLPLTRSGMAMVKLNGLIYALGGTKSSSDNGQSDDVLVYDPITDNWSYAAPMNDGRSSFSAVALGGFIYAINGNFTNQRSVEAYNPVNNTWWYVADTLTSHSIGAAAVANGTIYAIGGWMYKNAVEAYYPQNNTWRYVAPLNHARQGHAAVTVNGQIFALGGTHSGMDPGATMNSLEMYSPNMDSWTDCPQMSASRYLPAAVGLDDGIIIVVSGGTTITEKYDIATRSWTKLADIPVARYDLGAVVARGLLHAIGGRSDGMFGSPEFDRNDVLDISNLVGSIPPKLTITSHPDSAWLNDANISFEGNFNEGSRIVKVEACLNSGNWTSCQVKDILWSCRFLLNSGTNRLQVRAYDLYDDYDFTGICVTVDMVLPKVEITSPKTGGITSNTGITLVGKASDDVYLVGVEVSSGGIAWIQGNGSDNWSAYVKLKSGLNVIYARAVDKAGNMNTSAISVYLDDMPPVVIIDQPANTNISKANIKLYGNITDDQQVHKVEININGALWTPLPGNSSWSYNVTLNVGWNNITVRAFDSVGNQGNASIQLTYTPKKPEAQRTPGFSSGLVIGVVALLGILNLYNRRIRFLR